jgi:TetR/AcrR family transcriptional regulator, cholesterol catabolism regulator
MARPTRWNEIVDAAATLFRQKGFVATSLEDIAGEVGMYKGSLYHYIKSKEDLLTAVVREPADQILADVRDVAGQDMSPSEKIRRITRSLLRVLDESFTRCAVYLDEVAGRHRSDEWAAMDREYVLAVVGVIEDGQRCGEFSRLLDPRTTTLALIGSLHWLTRWYEPGGALAGAEIADNLCDSFLVGLLSRPSS